MSEATKEPTEWTQERPAWCPHEDCQFNRRAMDSTCVGNLPEPAPHDGDFNHYRLCMNGALPNDEVFNLQVNGTDLEWFRWMFDALDGKATSWLSKFQKSERAKDTTDPVETVQPEEPVKDSFPYTINVNGSPKVVEKQRMSYIEIVRLASGVTPDDVRALTVTFKGGLDGMEGHLHVGDFINVKDGTVFNVVDTGNVFVKA